MKPVVLHIHFWADIRNSAGSVEKVITAFAAHGASYEHLIACCPGGKLKCEPPFRHHGVAVHHFHENHLLNRVMNKMLRLGAFTYGDLVELIKRLRPAILHFHNRQELADLLVHRLDYRPKLVIHYHRHFAEPVVPHNADLLLFISEATARDILGKSGSDKPHRIVPNPLSLELLAHADSAESTQATARVPTILFGGGANPIKGGKELVEAFRRCPPGSAHLVLAGRGVETFDIIDPTIEILGEIPADKFFTRMRAADIVAMPSYDEPFGLIAQEAMLLRKLLVTTGSGGLAEFVGNDNAVLVRPNDISSLRDGLMRAVAIMGNSDQLARLLDNAEARARTFSPEDITRQLEFGYDSLIDPLS